MKEITKQDIKAVLAQLRVTRPVFYSEDDFKMNFGFQVYKFIQQFSDKNIVYLERPEDINYIQRTLEKDPKKVYIDMVIELDGKQYPVELKYRTIKLKEPKSETNSIELLNQGACDAGRYQFRKDIYRLEQLTEKAGYEKGFAIFLTNDFHYWDFEFDERLLDFHYRFKDMMFKEDKGWNYKNAIYSEHQGEEDGTHIYRNKKGETHWTCWKEYFHQLTLKKDYEIIWNDYYTNGKDIFKYVIVEV